MVDGKHDHRVIADKKTRCLVPRCRNYTPRVGNAYLDGNLNRVSANFFQCLPAVISVKREKHGIRACANSLAVNRPRSVSDGT